MIYAAAAQVLRTNRPIYIIYLVLLLGLGTVCGRGVSNSIQQQQPARIKIKLLGVCFN